MQKLFEHIKKFSQVSDSDLKLIESVTSKKVYDKKDHLLTAGHRCHFKYFILSGCMRSYFMNNKGGEQIVNFGIEDWWMTDYDSFVNEDISHLNIQALEQCEVLRLSRSDFDHVVATSAGLNTYFRVILEKRHIADQRRIQYMFNMSGEEIYDHFNRSNPDFVQRVPQYMLASYLGFTPEFLSKIRKRKIENGS
ncbi:cAMP-binding domain of CRP or a regulatory subunit of cAMP-dependent protein kinases [Reichenbachiella faecimaris]|uniref:cAMP-binding domain of CRP or a regulatory subunit of cAMP-dependent protein kinases n=1 Tax=Reichenbachiella faecimaris TaxID=692418 RepID=A0A1W2G8T9_REIFA|nr:Crp/Fnr family transcriptional regulator [Reichenbachiella faecimaris]SMD33087.1 cAMP-binding domain of CRP or a regulatory subunit of cAMP-dependent protein kinases [Reichenbachiella faecimaris]